MKIIGKRTKRTSRWLGAALAAMLSAPAAQAASVSVGLELSLLVDVSGSITTSEYNLQRTGYANAFQSAAVQNAIAANPTGSIAVNMIMWSGASQQSLVVPWTLIDSATAANNFAAAILAVNRPFSGSTAPQNALNFAYPLFASNEFDAPRQVIDVSGDGSRNDGSSGAVGRDAALLAGIDTINGLVIGSDPSVLTYYTNFVIGGTNPFVVGANDFGAFGAAIQEKLVKEIVNPVPVPAALPMFLSGLAAMGFFARRSKKVAA